MSALLVVSVTVILLVANQAFGHLNGPTPLVATTLDRVHRGATSRQALLFDHVQRASKKSVTGSTSPTARRQRPGRDPLNAHRAIVGPDARTPWYIRVRAAVLLLFVVVALGAALAGVTLLVIATARVLLETLAG